MWSDSPNTSPETHNQAGCPYVNQGGADAVLDWARVLVNIDRVALPQSLQAELQQLQIQVGLHQPPARVA